MIDPAAARVLLAMQSDSKPMPQNQAAWLEGYRAQLAALGKWQRPAPAIETRTVDHIRLLRPAGPGPWPTLLFIHGGGFVAGSLDAYDTPLRHLAIASSWQIAMVDYRLAPEHPFPAAAEDCLAALRFLATSPEVITNRIAIAGDSAGGLLAAVTTIAARDQGIALCGQILLYPNTDLRPGPLYPSRTEFDGTVIRMPELYRSLDLYAGPADRADPRLSPILAKDLARLPPTLLVSNECDPLRDEAEAFAARLAEAGTRLTHRRIPGMIHGVLQYAAAVPAGAQLIADLADTLARFAPTAPDAIA